MKAAQLDLEPMPICDADTAGGGFTCYATVTAPTVPKSLCVGLSAHQAKSSLPGSSHLGGSSPGAAQGDLMSGFPCRGVQQQGVPLPAHRP